MPSGNSFDCCSMNGLNRLYRPKIILIGTITCGRSLSMMQMAIDDRPIIGRRLGEVSSFCAFYIFNADCV